MLTFFSNTVTQVKPYGSFKNVLRTVLFNCKAPSVKKKKKKKESYAQHVEAICDNSMLLFLQEV